MLRKERSSVFFRVRDSNATLSWLLRLEVIIPYHWKNRCIIKTYTYVDYLTIFFEHASVNLIHVYPTYLRLCHCGGARERHIGTNDRHVKEEYEGILKSFMFLTVAQQQREVVTAQAKLLRSKRT